MLIKRESITHAARKREEVTVQALGGEVAVVQMGLAARLAIEAVATRDRNDPASFYASVPHVLAACVVDADELPLMTADQWSLFGVENRDVVIELFNTAMRLSGIGESTEKN